MIKFKVFQTNDGGEHYFYDNGSDNAISNKAKEVLLSDMDINKVFKKRNIKYDIKNFFRNKLHKLNSWRISKYLRRYNYINNKYYGGYSKRIGDNLLIFDLFRDELSNSFHLGIKLDSEKDRFYLFSPNKISCRKVIKKLKYIEGLVK